MNKSLATAAIIAPAACLGVRAHAQTIFESFENGFGVWTPHGNLYCNEWPDCPPLEFSITPTTDQAQDGKWSLDATANGSYDAGIVWVERPILLLPGSWDIQVDFQIYTPQESWANNALAAAYIGLTPPDNKLGFQWLGEISAQGWNPFSHSATLDVSEPTMATIALGYKLVWESWFTYWIDSVAISGVPEHEFGNGDVNLDGVVNVDDLIHIINGWGPCTVDPPAICPQDQNLDDQINIDDLLIVVANWD
jgi:hypothetical protein